MLAKDKYFLQIICKEYYRTKLVPSFPRFLPYEPCLSETSEHETAVAISFQGMRQRFEFVNFKEHKFFFFLKLLLLLNVLSKTVCHARSPVWTTWRVSLSKLLVFQTKLENLLVKSFHRTNTTTLRTSFQAKSLHHFSIVLRNLSLNFALKYRKPECRMKL